MSKTEKLAGYALILQETQTGPEQQKDFFLDPYIDDQFEDSETEEVIVQKTLYQNRGSFFDADSLCDMYIRERGPENEETTSVSIVQKEEGGLIKIMDGHNFYESGDDLSRYIRPDDLGLLTKLWMSILKVVEEK